MLPIDADSHFFEPLDLFERYIDARFRERTYRVEKDPAGKIQFVVDQKPLQVLDAEGVLRAVVGYGQKETGRNLSNFDPDLPLSSD